jgi:hypothetical protein
MEERSHLASALADLARAFPQREVTAGTLGIYLQNLSDLPVAAVVDACTVLIRTSEFFPTVHAIRETVAESLLGLPSEAEALALVNSKHASRCPLVREALEAVGGYHAWAASREPTMLRGQLLRIYRDLRAARINEAIAGTLALDPAPARRELSA